MTSLHSKSQYGKIPYGLIAAVLAAIVPLGWAGAGHVIAGVDIPPIVDYELLVKTTSHTWDPAANGGISNFIGYGTYWPLLLGGALAQQLLHVPAWAIASAMVALAWGAAALGAYLLAAELGVGVRLRLVAALAYTLNMAHTLLAPGLQSMIAYAALPWFAVSLLTSLRSTAVRRFGLAALSALATTLLVFVKINPPTYITLYLGGAIVAAIAAVAVRAKLRPLLEWLIPFAVLTLAFNSWWIYDFLVALKLDPAAVTAQLDVRFVSRSSTIGQVFLLGGSWAMDGSLDGYSPFPYAPWYRSGLIQSLLTLFPAGVLLAALGAIASRAVRITLLSIAVVIFIDAGYHEPLGGLFTWCFAHVPGFWLFREPLTKFDGVAALLYVVTLVIAFRDAPQLSRRAVGSLVAVACLGAVVGGLPALAGSVVPEKTATMPSWRVAVPAYWTQLAADMNRRDGGRLVVYPQSGFYQLGYRWGYFGADINGMLFRHPYIDVTSSNSYSDSTMRSTELAWYDAFNARDFDAASMQRLTHDLAIGYLIDRGDTTSISRQLSEDTFQARLRMLGFRYMRNYGPVRVYEREEFTETREARLELGPYAVSCGEADLGALRYFVGDDRVTLRSPWSGCAGAPTVLRPLPNFTFALSARTQDRQTKLFVGDPRVLIDAPPILQSRGEDVFVDTGTGFRRVLQGGYLGEIGLRTSGIELSRATLLHQADIVAGTARSFRSRRKGPREGLIEVESSTPLQQIGIDISPDKNGDGSLREVRDLSPWAPTRATFRVPLGRKYTVFVEGAKGALFHVREYGVVDDRTVRLTLKGFQGPTRQATTVQLHSGTQRLPLAGSGWFHLDARLRPEDRVELRSGDPNDEGRVLATIDASTSLEVELTSNIVTARLVPVAGGRRASAQLTLRRSGLSAWVWQEHNGRVTAFTKSGVDETSSRGTYDARGDVVARLPQAFSHGWKLLVDGRPVAQFATLQADNAWVLPAGHHTYEVYFAPERPAELLRTFALMLAMVTVLGALGALMFERHAILVGVRT